MTQRNLNKSREPNGPQSITACKIHLRCIQLHPHLSWSEITTTLSWIQLRRCNPPFLMVNWSVLVETSWLAPPNLCIVARFLQNPGILTSGAGRLHIFDTVFGFHLSNSSNLIQCASHMFPIHGNLMMSTPFELLDYRLQKERTIS